MRIGVDARSRSTPQTPLHGTSNDQAMISGRMERAPYNRAMTSYYGQRTALRIMAGFLLASGCMDPGVEENDRAYDHGQEGSDALEPASAALPEQIEKGGATSSCLGLWASGSGPLGGPNSVSGRCRTVDGRYLDTEAWLPGCMGNVNGSLVWGGLYFDRSCRNCQLSMQLPLPARYRLSCECRRADGQFVPASIPVSDFLTNRNGVLTCD